ncbi:DUF805 domain-containing protein [Caulobacter soli]|uniref:DUF805 domain-containing protein n=1 Tax=Caulobacter soli TaxID=2708539 RepID=UPI0013EACACF|nr:DUF805 domain-containing protein [Caulobacter soli]
MNELVASIRSGFTGLLRFSGRDTASRFWPYAGLVIALFFLATAAIVAPTVMSSFAKMQAFAIAHPDQATITQGAGSYSIEIHGDHPELMPDMTPFFAVMRAGCAVAVALLAAAVTRRLHDRGRRGWWGLPPLVFLTTGMILFPPIFQTMMRQSDVSPGTLAMFGLIFANNILYLASLGLLIFLLAGASQAGENRFGPPAP